MHTSVHTHHNVSLYLFQITRRYAEFSAALVSINQSHPDDQVDQCLSSLQGEVENFILRMAAEFPQRREQLVFLINNYDMMLSVLTVSFLWPGFIPSLGSFPFPIPCSWLFNVALQGQDYKLLKDLDFIIIWMILYIIVLFFTYDKAFLFCRSELPRSQRNQKVSKVFFMRELRNSLMRYMYILVHMYR